MYLCFHEIFIYSELVHKMKVYICIAYIWCYSSFELMISAKVHEGYTYRSEEMLHSMVNCGYIMHIKSTKCCETVMQHDTAHFFSPATTEFSFFFLQNFFNLETNCIYTSVSTEV